VVVVLGAADVVVSGSGATVTGGVVTGGASASGLTAAAAALPARPSDRLATTASADAPTTVTRAATRPILTRLRPPAATGGLNVSGSTAATVWQTAPKREYPSP
jgi:hypothetical protein